MPDNASPKSQILVAYMDIQQDAKNYIQKINKNHSTISRDISDLLFQRTLGMPDHTQPKRHDNTEASLDV